MRRIASRRLVDCARVSPTPSRPPLRVLLGVGLVAGSTLALQVLLTRVFAAVLYYHFGFLAISLALLGRRRGGDPDLRPPALVRDRSARARRSRAGASPLAVLLAAVRGPRARAARLHARRRDHHRLRAQPRRWPACWRRCRSSPAGIVIALAVRGYAQLDRPRLRLRPRRRRHRRASWSCRCCGLVDAPTLLVGARPRGGAGRPAVRRAARPRAAPGSRAAPRPRSCSSVLAATTTLYYLAPLRAQGRPGGRALDAASRVLGYLPARPGRASGRGLRPRLSREIIRYTAAASRCPTGASSGRARRRSATRSPARGARS